MARPVVERLVRRRVECAAPPLVERVARGRFGLLVAALALVASAACSDDDPEAAPAASTVPSTTAPGDVVVAPDPPVAVRTVELEGRPSAVAVTAAGLWITSDHEPADPDGGGALRLHDPASGAVVATWRLPPNPVAVEPVGAGVWVVGASGSVSRVASTDPAAPVARTELGGALVDAVAVDDRVYVGDIERSMVHVLDAATGEVAGPPIPVPAGVVRLAAGAGRLWATGLEREVTPIDLATGAVGPPVEVGDGPIGLAVHEGTVWVADSDAGGVSRIDAATARPAGPPVPTGAAPIAVAVDGAGVLWAVNQDDATVVALDPSTGARAADPLPIGIRARGLAPSPDGGVWVVGVEPSLAVHVPPA